jgi:hypothetical protein
VVASYRRNLCSCKCRAITCYVITFSARDWHLYRTNRQINGVLTVCGRIAASDVTRYSLVTGSNGKVHGVTLQNAIILTLTLSPALHERWRLCRYIRNTNCRSLRSVCWNVVFAYPCAVHSAWRQLCSVTPILMEAAYRADARHGSLITCIQRPCDLLRIVAQPVRCCCICLPWNVNDTTLCSSVDLAVGGRHAALQRRWNAMYCW